MDDKTMDAEKKKEAEIYGAMGMGSTTPDSGIDFGKFNIVEYILSNTEDMEIPHEESSAWEIEIVSSVPPLSDESNSSVSPVSATASLSPVTLVPTEILKDPQIGKPWAENPTASSTPSRSGPQLRTLTKLELDRKKAIQDTKREEEAQNKFHLQRAHHQSNPVDLPVSTSPTITSIPQNLLKKVKTRLENPTKYYLTQRAIHNHNIVDLQSNDNNNGLGGSVPPTYAPNSLHGQMAHANGLAHPGPGSAPPNVFCSTPVNSLTTSAHQVQLETGVPPSPGPTISSVATSLTSGCSDNFEPFLPGLEGDDISAISLAEITDIISQDGEGLFNYSNGSLPPKFGGSRGSQDGKAASAPLDSPETPQPEGHFRAAKDRQKKDNHNKIERRRRFLINDMITIQGTQLPKQGELYFDKIGEIKQNKGAVLQASVEYINLLKQDNEMYRKRDSLTQQENKKLLLRIKELEQVCSQSGISLPEESLTWKSPPPDRLSSFINEEVRVKEEPLSDQRAVFCELMEDDRDRNHVTGPCDPMLAPCGQVDPDDIGLASTLESVEMEFT